MKKMATKTKWTHGKSTIERVTKRNKANLAIKQKALHAPLKFLNSLFSK
jgi:hypothetical protein